MSELCSRFKDPDANRFLVEVRWWRDNAYRLPWLPPASEASGSRYRRMMMLISPDEYALEEQGWQEIRERYRQRNPERFRVPATLSTEMAALVASALPAERPAAPPGLVDWSFLDTDDGQPGELPGWARKQLKLFGREPEIAKHITDRAQYSRPIPPPTTPPNRNPNEPSFDPEEFGLDMDEGDDEF